MARALIYVRVSTDEQAQSAETQEAAARAWCERAGHEVADVIRDIGYSGAEWINRPGPALLEAGARRKPRPWDLVVVRDADRIGRDAHRLPRLCAIFRERGVQVVEYSTGRSMELDGFGVVVVNVMAAVAQVEREAIARRTRGAHASMHARGQVVGGRVYGYRNVRTAGGVHYEPHATEAPVVREMFARRAAGETIRALARDLNSRGLPSPFGGQWSPSVVGSILRRERYLGVLSWGRATKRYVDGTLVRARDGDVARIERPELALIDPDTWSRVRALDLPVRGRTGTPARHLLVGHAVCDRCERALVVLRTRHGNATVPAYACGGAKDRGPAGCPVRMRRRVEELDELVLEWMEREAYAPGVLEEMLRGLRARFEAGAAPDTRRADLARARAAADRERSSLVDAIARAPDLHDELVPRLRAARDRAARAAAELSALDAAPTPPGWEDVERRARADWGALADTLRAETPEGRRTAMAALLDGGRWRAAMVTVGGRRCFELRGAVHLPPRGLLVSPAGIAQIPRVALPVVLRPAA